MNKLGWRATPGGWRRPSRPDPSPGAGQAGEHAGGDLHDDGCRQQAQEQLLQRPVVPAQRRFAPQQPQRFRQGRDAEIDRQGARTARASALHRPAITATCTVVTASPIAVDHASMRSQSYALRGGGGA